MSHAFTSRVNITFVCCVCVSIFDACLNIACLSVEKRLLQNMSISCTDSEVFALLQRWIRIPLYRRCFLFLNRCALSLSLPKVLGKFLWGDSGRHICDMCVHCASHMDISSSCVHSGCSYNTDSCIFARLFWLDTCATGLSHSLRLVTWQTQRSCLFLSWQFWTELFLLPQGCGIL